MSLIQEDPAWANFLRGMNRSEETKSNYSYIVKDYMKFLGIERASRLLEFDERTREDNIQRYIDAKIEIKNSRHLLLNRINAITKFYNRNRIKIDSTFIRESVPETVDNRDRPYTREEISKAAKIAGLRERTVILFLASTGVREGALASLVENNP